MKSFIDNSRKRVKEYWKRLMESHKRRMSRGAQDITKLQTVAHKDQWRRNEGPDHK